ncbi:MAG: hypothetical protein ACOH2M_28870, partial [Cypionkella sp.]
ESTSKSPRTRPVEGQRTRPTGEGQRGRPADAPRTRPVEAPRTRPEGAQPARGVRRDMETGKPMSAKPAGSKQRWGKTQKDAGRVARNS